MDFIDVISKSRVDNVTLRRPKRKNLKGSLSVTGHHLMFVAGAGGDSEDVGSTFIDSTQIMILHKLIDVATVDVKPQANRAWLSLKCKNFLILIMEFESAEDCVSVGKSVEILSNLADPVYEYPFYYGCPFTPLENGWGAFTTEQEFARLQIHSDLWRISNVNAGFKVCRSYPEQVIVPKKISDDSILEASASFRDGGRFPVLSYYHRDTRSALIRCAQPLAGQSNRRCRQDEQLLNCMLAGSSRGYILDTRSLPVAQNARNKGGGYEPDVNYPMWKRVHRAVPRWNVFQDSLSKLIEACNDSSLSSDKWLAKLNGSGWLQIVGEVLTCACVGAQCLDREGETAEVSVVVHGGEGLDSTLMVTSLIQIILDPDARTVRGFESLIEREWISAGHPFWHRCAHAAYAKGKSTGQYEAPSFLLFLDCVWQIHQQFAFSFEFNEDFLLFLFEQAYASDFGSFLGNSEKQRADIHAKTKTVSLWSHINRPETLQQYLNAFYEPNGGPIWPSVAPQSLLLWERVYLRWVRDWSEQDAAQATMNQWKNQEKDLISKVAKLRRHIVELEREANLQKCTESDSGTA